MSLQAQRTNGAAAIQTQSEWPALPTLPEAVAADLEKSRDLVNRLLRGDRLAVRKLVLELDRSKTEERDYRTTKLMQALRDIRHLRVTLQAAMTLVSIADERLNLGIMMGPQPGERAPRAKRRAA